MGFIQAKLILKNPRKTELKPALVTARVDTGALHLCIPEHIAIQLDLDELYKREVTIADGSIRQCPYVGPIELRFDNRACFTGALVIGDEVLLGAVPMEDLDVVISPSRQTIEVNPDSPNYATSIVK